MKIKKLFVRRLIAIILGLCAGIVMEFDTSGLIFPTFLIIGVLAGIFVEIVIEVIRGTLTITREDLRKMKNPVLRILVATSIGLLAGIVLEHIAIWAAFPLFFILGVFAGAAFGTTIELVRYSRSMRRTFLEGKGLGMEHLPVSTAELIRLVIKKMRYRRKVCQDVQEELAAHFEDELKDCETDGDRRQKAKALIAGFGDVKLLAVLLRRAKKRCRPLWRTMVARTFQTVGVLILCFIFYMVWFLTGKPVITTNYVAELNKKVRPSADESLNAAPLYLRAVGLQKELSDDFILFLAENRQVVVDETFPQRIEVLAGKIDRVFSDRGQKDFQEERQGIRDEVSKVFDELQKKKYNELTIEQKNISKRWIQEQEDALELVVEGSRRPYYWRTYKSGGDNPDVMLGVLLPNLSDFRRLAYVLRLRAGLRAEQGRYEEAFDDMKSCYCFGQHLRGDKFLVEQLVGMAFEVISVQTIRDIAGRYKIDSKLLTDIHRNFEQIIAGEDFITSLEAERLFIYDEIQRCFTDGRFGGGHLYLSRISALASDYQDDVEEMVIETIFSPQQWPRAVKVLFAHPDKEQTRETADRYYDFWTRLYRKTPGQIKAEGIDAEKEALEIIEGNIFLQILAPALTRVNIIAYRRKTEVHATVAVLALLRYQKDKGSFPEDLEQLISAGYLKQPPDDVFSEKPLVYRNTEEDFILYSVGPDFIDDGGVSSKDRKGQDAPWREDGDTIFWPVAKLQALK